MSGNSNDLLWFVFRPLGAVLGPVSDLVGAVVGAAVGGLLEQHMGGTTTPGIAQRVNDGLKASLLASLTTSLIRPLTATASAVLSFAGPLSLRATHPPFLFVL